MEAFPHDPGPPHQMSRSERVADGRNKVQRIGDQTRGLFEDFKTWVELRLRLFQLDVQEKIQSKVNEILVKVAPIVVGAVAGFFLLITIALFVGWLLGHPAWGFLVVTGLLFFVAGILYARSRKYGESDKEVEVTGSSTHEEPLGES